MKAEIIRELIKSCRAGFDEMKTLMTSDEVLSIVDSAGFPAEDFKSIYGTSTEVLVSVWVAQQVRLLSDREYRRAYVRAGLLHPDEFVRMSEDEAAGTEDREISGFILAQARLTRAFAESPVKALRVALQIAERIQEVTD